MWKSICLAIAIAAATPAVEAQQQATALTDVTGTWVMNLESHQLGLELEQKGSKVEGVLHAMGTRILLVGTFADRKLELKGERTEDQLPHTGAGAGPIVATMLDDGTLEGELSTNRGRTKWTGERLQKP
jgi:hypothetical protein